ncbi:cyclic AMP-dependent transcription factor ATF-4 isoform X2 [Cimex lectularius]|uniref:BZIP domain-containing protein n=1 Tax=Cimex lectularius TaxID=79782 RepID=A0A8I6RJD5_CIMLE|nr:cyclic AMP-dependent transcription factor ATF-4 isoform X2 [Cimex lectularius]
MYALQPQNFIPQISQLHWPEGLYEGYDNMDVWDCYKNFTPMAVPNVQQELPMVIPSQTDLLREFEDVLTQTTESLTPPDSPQSQEQIFINILEEMNPGEVTTTQLVDNTEKPNVAACSPLCVEPWSSPSPSQSDSGYDDPDWSPGDWSPGQTVPEPKRSHRKTTTTEERKLRKKEQNKNAATRYRQKKKQEMEGIMGEEKGLQDENDRLKTDVTEITREIRYLKSLMRDLFKAKGLLK